MTNYTLTIYDTPEALKRAIEAISNKVEIGICAICGAYNATKYALVQGKGIEDDEEV